MLRVTHVHSGSPDEPRCRAFVAVPRIGSVESDSDGVVRFNAMRTSADRAREYALAILRACDEADAMERSDRLNGSNPRGVL